MKPEDETPATDDQKTDMPASATESAAEGGQTDQAPAPADAATDPTPAPADAASEGPQHEPAPMPDDPPVDDKVAKGKGDKARAATLGQVAAPKPKPVKTAARAEPDPDHTVLRTRAFPGPLLAFGGRARRSGWAAGHELTAQNASDRTGRKMQLMTTGARSGPVEWKPQHMADELMADDWEVIVPNDQLALFQALINGEADPEGAGPA